MFGVNTSIYYVEMAEVDQYNIGEDLVFAQQVFGLGKEGAYSLAFPHK